MHGCLYIFRSFTGVPILGRVCWREKYLTEILFAWLLNMYQELHRRIQSLWRVWRETNWILFAWLLHIKSYTWISILGRVRRQKYLIETLFAVINPCHNSVITPVYLNRSLSTCTARFKLSLNNSFTESLIPRFIQNDSHESIKNIVIPLFLLSRWHRVPPARKRSYRGSFRATEFLWTCLIFAHKSPAFNPVMNVRAALSMRDFNPTGSYT